MGNPKQAAPNRGAFKKGEKRPGQGRPKGTLNKATVEFRQTVQALLDDNRDNVKDWLSQVATGHGDVKADPAKALDLLAKLAEFAAPKLGRTEHVGEGGGPLQVNIIRYGGDNAA